MARKIKVKTIVTLDSVSQYHYELEEGFDGDMHGNDLAEAVIKVASTTVSDVVREIVEKDSLAQ